MVKPIRIWLFLLSLIGALIVSCTPRPDDTEIPYTPTTIFTSTPELELKSIPSLTPSPSAIPPTKIPFPTSASKPNSSADLTVCQSGCDFQRIQDAIDSSMTQTGTIIEVMDSIHTEGGIIVSKGVIIRGKGAELTTIQAHPDLNQATDRVFFIPEDISAVLTGLTIQHGNPQPDKYFRCGGGIANLGILTVENCVIQGNTANDGGGIWSRRGELRIVNTSIRNNTADRKATEEDFSIPNYSSTSACGSGGGIKLVGGGSLYLLNSTVNNNVAKSHGGGIFVACNTTATLVNSTISGNQATTWGGGIYVKGVLNLSHCTVSNNNAKAVCADGQLAARCPKGKGGDGVFIREIMNYSNTLITNNGRNDCVLGKAGEYGTLEDGKIGQNLNNFVGDGSCNAAQLGEAMLQRLADNGGLTHTHALSSGSPLINAIPNQYCVIAIDQRGFPRPEPGTDTNEYCDIGAYEVQYDGEQ